MKIRELTKEQLDKICDYITDKYYQYDKNGRLINAKTCCRECPFSVCDCDYYDCARPDLDKELSDEFEQLLKKDR